MNMFSAEDQFSNNPQPFSLRTWSACSRVLVEMFKSARVGQVKEQGKKFAFNMLEGVSAICCGGEREL